MLSAATNLVEWFPDGNNPDELFTVYRTEKAIEVHLGVEPRENARLIGTHKAYESAYEFAELLASQTNLPLQNYVTFTQ
jgi:hypothetical protein